MKCILSAAAFVALLTPGLAAAQDPAPPPTVVAREVTPPPAAPKSVILERVLVRVNGEIFTQTQLEQQRTDDLSDRNVEPAKVTAAMIAELTPDILVKAVDDLLLVQRG